MATRSPTRRLLDLVGVAHEFDDLDAFREGVPALLRAAVPADVGSYNEFDDDPTRPWWTSDPILHISDELGARFAELSAENPVLDHHARTRDGTPRRLSDFVSRDEFRAMRLYRDFYRHVGVEHLVGLTLPSRPPVVIGLGLTRDGDVDFSDGDVALLALARPHLIQAYRKAELASTRSTTIAALGRGLEALAAPVLVADDRGRVPMAPPLARRLLARRLGAGGSTSRLAGDVREALTRRRAHRTPSAEPLRLD